MEVSRLEPALLGHLSVEFGAHGERAVEFLDTAQALLELETQSVPRLGEVVAYCIREALKEIPKASGAGDPGRWSRLSRAVVDAADRFESAEIISGEDDRWELSGLRSAVDELRIFHASDASVHQARLVAAVVNRAGVEPLSSGTAPVVAYQDLLDRADTAAHGFCTVETACELWGECVVLLRQLFLPHELRSERLERLARIEAPSEDDFGEVLRLSGTRVHVQRFLGKVSHPRWLWLFGCSDALGTPGSDLWWSACSAAIRLADSHREEVSSWLGTMYDKHDGDVEHARCFAHAAYRVSGSAHDLLLRLVRRYPCDDRVALAGRDAALELDAAHPLVEQFADVLINEDSWSRIILADQLVAHLGDGVNEHNALSRIRVVCFKLRKVSDTDLALGGLRYDRAGSVADAHTVFPDDRSSVLLGCLTRVFRRAWDWYPTEALLESTASLPAVLQGRLRSWVLAHAPAAEADALAAEIERAIRKRDATGDDVALVDRATDVCDLTGIVDSWRDALGPAPTVGEVSRKLGSEELLPEEWYRAWTWIPLLPDYVTDSWRAPYQVLVAVLGESRGESLAERSIVEARSVESPIAAEELKSIPARQAAEVIARWRPDPGAFYVSARQLARTLEDVIKDDPVAWLSDPVAIATKLRHPMYISHFLQAAAQCPTDSAQRAPALFDVIQLVQAEPWPAEVLGSNDFDFDSDWREARRSAVDLIRALTRAGFDFGDRSDEVWDLIKSAAMDRSESPWLSSEDDPVGGAIHRAVNRTCTRAFETALIFVDSELQRSEPLRPAFTDLLEFGLRLHEPDGAEFRAALAPYVAWLRHRLPDWTNANLELIFGADAPGGLGRFTVDLILRQGRPDKWLLEIYPEMIRGAVARGVEGAIRHYLVAMLWRCSGYGTADVAGFLKQHPGLLREAGRHLAMLVRNDDADEGHVRMCVALWRELLDSEAASSLEGFGWMSTVSALDTELWAKLTLATLQATDGRVDCAHRVADRATSQPATVTKLAILNQLVRRHGDHWELRRLADHIEEFLATTIGLTHTAEYEQLRTALQERGLID
ncbi:MAG: hypothetical protein OXF61_16525 [Acidimicrobiaceae bacterium]|nr:hypothetical protein [Acidimicrobiaceae bacterium]